MTLEHPYKGIYLDQQFKNGHRPTQAYRRRPPRTSWIERLIGATLLLAAACSLLLALFMVAGMVWLIGMVVQEIVRWWR